MMIRRLSILLAVAAALAASCGCSRARTFTVEGEIDGLGTQGLRMAWRNASGLVSTAAATAVDHTFTLEGSAPDTTLMEIFSSSGVRILTLPVVDGESPQFTLGPQPADANARRLLTVKGSDIGSRWAETVNGLPSPADPEALNSAVAAYITAHPADPVAAMLLASEFTVRGHEAEADSLAAALRCALPAVRTALGPFTPEQTMPHRVRLRVRADSTVWTPSAGIWVFTASTSERTTALMDSMAAWHSRADSAAPLHDVYFSPDERTWRMHVQADSIHWLQAIAPEGPAATALRPLRIPSTPYVIEVDSLHRIISRHTPY